MRIKRQEALCMCMPARGHDIFTRGTFLFWRGCSVEHLFKVKCALVLAIAGGGGTGSVVLSCSVGAFSAACGFFTLCESLWYDLECGSRPGVLTNHRQAIRTVPSRNVICLRFAAAKFSGVFHCSFGITSTVCWHESARACLVRLFIEIPSWVSVSVFLSACFVVALSRSSVFDVTLDWGASRIVHYMCGRAFAIVSAPLPLYWGHDVECFFTGHLQSPCGWTTIIVSAFFVPVVAPVVRFTQRCAQSYFQQ